VAQRPVKSRSARSRDTTIHWSNLAFKKQTEQHLGFDPGVRLFSLGQARRLSNPITTNGGVALSFERALSLGRAALKQMAARDYFKTSASGCAPARFQCNHYVITTDTVVKDAGVHCLKLQHSLCAILIDTWSVKVLSLLRHLCVHLKHM